MREVAVQKATPQELTFAKSETETRISEWKKRTDLAEIAYAFLGRASSEYVRCQLKAPPPLPPFLLSLGKLGKPFIGALQAYWETVYGGSVMAVRSAPAEWHDFERELGRLFAFLLMALADYPREGPRKDFLCSTFLGSLTLRESRGRPRKSQKERADVAYGQAMEILWHQELQEAWNMRSSLEKAHRDFRTAVARRFKDDVAKAVLARKATPESSLAAVYAHRFRISKGRARNALRAYQKLTGLRIAAQI
jgi:hypothetical protein